MPQKKSFVTSNSSLKTFSYTLHLTLVITNIIKKFIFLFFKEIMSKNKNLLLAKALIDELGGLTKVAGICKITAPSVFTWKIYGVPDARLMFLQLKYPNLNSWKLLDK